METSATDALNHTQKSRTDGAGRTRESVDQLQKISTFFYDNNGNRVSWRDANSVGQDCIFDARNRETQCTDTHGDVTKRVYDAHNNVVTMTDALNHNTTCVFDARDRKVSCTDRIAGTTNYLYDANNNLQTLTDAQGGATNYVFDVRNLLQSETFPDGRSRYYGYDAGHRIVSRLDQANVLTNYVYDRANRMTSRTYPDSLNDTFSYDNASRLTLASSARYSNSVARVYDSASHLTVETLTVGATSYNLGYGYDADNRQTAVIYPSGDVVTRSFTDRNQLDSASFNNVAVANLSYDDGRRLSTKSFGNGTVENRTYRNDNLISSIVTPTVDTFTYTWDANKRKLSQSETGIPTNNQTYSYDSEDRLTNFARTNGDAQSWNLSLVGDWNSFSKNGTVENRTHNAVHETTAVNSIPLTYDVKGNLTQNKNGQTYSWDVENRLILATDGFNTLGSYTYDALGRRVSKTVAANTTVFVSDGLQEIAEYVNGALSQSYVYGAYIDEPLVMVKANGTKFYYHTNDLYSVAALTDANGNVVERYKYDPYGKVTILGADGVTVRTTSSVGNTTTFTGRRLDAETGLMYYRARTYSVDLGRFLSRDPWVGIENRLLVGAYSWFQNVWEVQLKTNPTNDHLHIGLVSQEALLATSVHPSVGSAIRFRNIDLYMYSSNRPIRLLDPLGLNPCTCDVILTWSDELGKTHTSSLCTDCALTSHWCAENARFWTITNNATCDSTKPCPGPRVGQNKYLYTDANGDESTISGQEAANANTRTTCGPAACDKITIK